MRNTLVRICIDLGSISERRPREDMRLVPQPPSINSPIAVGTKPWRGAKTELGYCSLVRSEISCHQLGHGERKLVNSALEHRVAVLRSTTASCVCEKYYFRPLITNGRVQQQYVTLIGYIHCRSRFQIAKKTMTSSVKSFSSTQGVDAPSLTICCLHVILLDPRVLTHGILYLPTSIHTELFTEAALLIRRYGSQVRQAITLLVSHWPHDVLRVRELLPEQKTDVLLASRGSGKVSFLDMILEGLINTRPESQLTTLDLSGIHAPKAFQLPLLVMSPEERNSDRILNEIQEKCKHLADDEDSLDAVLSWKLNEMSKHPLRGSFQRERPVNIEVDCQLVLTDWVAMGDEIIGLLLQHQSPFRIKVTKLSIDNYYLRQVSQAKWFFSLLDRKALTKLLIYGKGRSIRQVLWDLSAELCALSSLKMFGLAKTCQVTSSVVSQDGPSEEAILSNTVSVLSTWAALRDVHLIGLHLGGRLRVWLDAIPGPLGRIGLFACHLVMEDIRHLSQSHHCRAITEVALEKNDLRGCAEDLVRLIANCTNLELLNLKESKLTFGEKQSVVLALPQCTRLHTLVMYGEEDLLASTEYEELTYLACQVPSLRTFYIFPFNYKPFEMFRREAAEEACAQILSRNNRTDLELFY